MKSKRVAWNLNRARSDEIICVHGLEATDVVQKLQAKDSPKHNGETHCAWAKNKVLLLLLLLLLIIIKTTRTKECNSRSQRLRSLWPVLSKWFWYRIPKKSLWMRNKHKRHWIYVFGTRMRVVEDGECKSCPKCYQSTGCYSKENGGVP